LLAHRAATIQFSLPVDWTSLSDRRKRQQHYCSECSLHVSSGITKGRAIKSKPQFRLLRERRSLLSCRSPRRGPPKRPCLP
jgi:hypothetical protein